MMQDVCQERNHLTIWLCPNLKKELDDHFSTDEGFKHCHLMNRANRATPRSSKYTGGSTTFMKTKSRLSKSLDHEAILVETFKYTQTLKANKERFDDERSAAHYNYMQRLDAATQQSQSPSGDETASESYKNRVFGLGSFFANGLRTSALVALSTSTSATSLADPKKVVDLREEVQKLTQELHQQAHSELMEKLEWLERLPEQIEVYNKQMCARGSGAAGTNGNTADEAPTLAPNLLP
ncbi:hypothetical protein Ahy_A03g012785 [Arachis hypogaea]|uniref:Uncharacterized protein n=1 Tax=Arachis hypogaea TaxID=3818 RepID=A0A445DU54_ARAHY|nr:hypothetical protein Ahy_A03g012785 [Arachis hypogaea]